MHKNAEILLGLVNAKATMPGSVQFPSSRLSHVVMITKVHLDPSLFLPLSLFLPFLFYFLVSSDGWTARASSDASYIISVNYAGRPKTALSSPRRETMRGIVAVCNKRRDALLYHAAARERTNAFKRA